MYGVSEMCCPASLVKANPSTLGRHGPTLFLNASQTGKEADSVRSRHARAIYCSLSSTANGRGTKYRADRNSDHIITGESPWVRSRTDDLLHRPCTAGCSTEPKQFGMPQRHLSSFSTEVRLRNIQRKHGDMEVRCSGSAIGWPAEVSDSSEGWEGDGKPAGPYCIYVGPLELADKCRLEALYQQARDEYYSGTPLILDDMFDKIELDQAQLLALSSVWATLLFGGLLLATGPPLCMAQAACQHVLFGMGGTREMGRFDDWQWGLRALSSPGELNMFLMMALSMLFGATLAFAAAKSLGGLSAGNLVALKGCCPSCGEEVYAFVKANECQRPRHKCECHVCSHPLVFHANLEPSETHRGRIWAYGRIYLVVRSTDLAPEQLSRRDNS